MQDRPDVQPLIASLEAQRHTLGDAAVDFALAALTEKLAAQAVPVSQPRLRQVSILFCDIAGSTEMLQHLRAEDALEVIGTAVQRFALQVVSAGGKVLRFSGDGLKAAFGAEQAREDDAERAVHAGLGILHEARLHAQRIRETHDVQHFGVRIGIDTGPVVLGGGIEADRTAMGHAVHIAARLEQSAPVGELRISHRTWVQVRGLFEVHKEPLLVVKGSDKPLQTYLVRGALPQADLADNRGPPSASPPMMGRDAELARLLALMQGARGDERLRSAAVMGEAGVGKSRLLRELLQALPAAGRRVVLVAGHPSSALQPYGMLRDLTARWLRIADDESAADARRRLVDGIAPLLDTHGEMAAHLIGRLIGLDFPDSPHLKGVEGRDLRERAFRAMQRTLLALSRREPLLLLLDDVHWADEGSLDFLQQLAESSAAAPITMIATARPTLLERRPAWLAGADARIELQPLDAAHGHALAAALLEPLPEPPRALLELLVARAAGNPFYAEELVRMLIDDGVIDTGGPQWRLDQQRLSERRVPETLVGVLQARLDALTEGERTALQQASIIGPVFWESALEAIDPQAAVALPALRSRGLVHARETSAFEGTTEYAFHHQLLHDVTYDTVLKGMRREGHAHAAQWLAARVADRAAELLAATAEHYDRAGDSVQALAYYERASVDAIQRCAFSACGVYTERALAQPALTDAAARYWLLSRRWWAADALSDSAKARQAMADMAAYAEACNDDAMRANVRARQALQADRADDAALAEQLAEEAVRLAEPSGAAVAATLGHAELAWLMLMRADYDGADRHVRAAIPWAQRAVRLPLSKGGAPWYELQVRLVGLESLMDQDRLVEAAAEIDAIDVICPAVALERCPVLQKRAELAERKGDLDGAQRGYEALITFSREIDVPRNQSFALVKLARIAGMRGDAATACTRAREAGDIARRTSLGRQLAHALESEGAALHALGDVEAGRERLAEAVALHRRSARSLEALEASAQLAEIERIDGDLAAARRQVDEILADPLADEMDPRSRVWCLQVLRATGDPRADALLQALHDRLLHIGRYLPDDAARRRLVDALPHWREVERQWRAAGDGASFAP